MPGGQCALGLLIAKEDNFGSFKDAIHWFKLAADQDDAEAQYHLAACYLNGKGVEKNTLEGERLLKLSIDNGNLYAEDILKMISSGQVPDWDEMIRLLEE